MGDVVRTLTQVAQSIGRPAVLLALDDAGAIAVAEHAAELRPYYLLPDQVPGLPRALADKRLLAQLCSAFGVVQPETRLITGERDAAAAVTDFGLPLVAKWAQPWLLPAGVGLRNTSLVRRAGQVPRLLQYVEGRDLLFQRFVPGGPHSDWFFHGYFDENSRCLYGGAGRKERAHPKGAGLTTYGRWLPNPVVEGTARELAERLGYRGVLDIDFRHDAGRDAYHLLDFNPGSAPSSGSSATAADWTWCGPPTCTCPAGARPWGGPDTAGPTWWRTTTSSPRARRACAPCGRRTNWPGCPPTIPGPSWPWPGMR